jgi:hypothetical protein
VTHPLVWALALCTYSMVVAWFIDDRDDARRRQPAQQRRPALLGKREGGNLPSAVKGLSAESQRRDTNWVDEASYAPVSSPGPAHPVALDGRALSQVPGKIPGKTSQ